MKNPFTKKVKNRQAYYLILIALGIGMAMMHPKHVEGVNDLSNAPIDAPAFKQKVNVVIPVVKPELVAKHGYQMHITGFSDVECGSKWCNRHEPKNNQIAINFAKYGRVNEVYIPAYDKIYRVVGNTDGKTDADIYFGQDHDAAVQFGSKTLLVNIIK